MKDTSYPIHSEQALRVLKALSNEARLRILGLLQHRAMNVSEIARELEVSQPTITTYVNQLEEAGLIFTRMQKSSSGYGRVCFLLHNSLTFMLSVPNGHGPESAIVLDMPVGHYSGIEVVGPSLLASQNRILASIEDTSRFFHPDRMEADLLFVRNGIVQYLFPYNVPEDRKIIRLELSMEASAELAQAQRPAEIQLSINGCEFDNCVLNTPTGEIDHHHMPGWYPSELTTAGQLLTWSVGYEGAKFNGQPGGAFTLENLNLRPMQPIQVGLRVMGSNPGQERGGVALFGKSFGRFDQDLRFKIYHEQQ